MKLLVLLFAGIAVTLGQDASCQDIKQCIDDVVASNGDRSRRIGQRLSRCDSRAGEYATELRSLQDQRQRIATECIANGPGPENHRCPAEFTRSKRQTPFRPQRVRPLKQCLQMIEGSTCKVKSQLCHQCYEMSGIHDRIHVLKLELQLIRQRCKNNRPARPAFAFDSQAGHVPFMRQNSVDDINFGDDQ